MSLVHSVSIDSSSSIATMTAISSSGHVKDASNGLYDDRDHFHSIFSNDSRFFDTSFHLFKTYLTMGYIQSDDEKSKQQQQHVPILTTTSNKQKHRWKTRLLGLNNNDHDNHQGTIKAFLTPTLLKKNNHNQFDSQNSTTEPINHPKKLSAIVQYQRPLLPTINISDSDKFDESDVIITRL